MAIGRAVPRRAGARGRRRCRTIRGAFTSARSTAACGGPTMPAAPGSRSSTRSMSARSARSRSRRPRPKTIYVGTGEADMRSDIAQGIGMFRSDRWRRDLDSRSGSRDTQQIGEDPGRSAQSRMCCSSPRSAILTARMPSAACSARRDGGAHWTKTLFKDADTGAIDLAFEPGNPERRLCRSVADAAAAVEHLSAVERAGQRPL